jgi:hypothetical protein
MLFYRMLDCWYSQQNRTNKVMATSGDTWTSRENKSLYSVAWLSPHGHRWDVQGGVLVGRQDSHLRRSFGGHDEKIPTLVPTAASGMPLGPISQPVMLDLAAD